MVLSVVTFDGSQTPPYLWGHFGTSCLQPVNDVVSGNLM